ncbi:TonB-dependent siderophore receptor [Paracandidimonas soli]|uniref:Outer membrane receptor for ferric coprogen and ferric-rhodotorulic acid n=1 Tax=Paracandidimonas soli TaxID=1917182 RepID=A0A4R3V626_9BURK|nr:TonB-dependent siderophore receptor [Paracandidimonas soli]TCU99021.1 outer membrane receptor for ferric coprogen and ferric-rhodotorulic acid [Paracandidimonas soli]
MALNPARRYAAASRHSLKTLVIALAHRGVVSIVALPVLAPVSAQAKNVAQEHRYAIPAGPLTQALSQFGREAGIMVSYTPELTDGKTSPGVQGQHSPASALTQLLAGTDLEAASTRSGSFVLRRVVAADVTTLEPVTVSGKAPGSITEGTGSYTTWSTSSSTRLNLTPQETPQAVTVVTRQRIADQRLNSLSDVLDATVGVTTKPFSLGTDSPQMWARGSSITNFQIDGVPISSSMNNYLQSTVMYDRVEIVKGATGIMSGLGTPAATINMILKRPTKEPQASISAEAGNWQRYGLGMDMSRPLNEDASVRGRLVADYKRDGAWTENYKQDYGVLYGIGEIDLGPRTLLSAGFSHITRNTDSPVRAFWEVYTNGQPTGASPSDGTSPDWAYYDHQMNSIFGSIEHTFDSGWSVKAELRHGRHEYEARMLAPVGAVDQATGLGGMVDRIRWASETEQTSLDAYATGPFSLFGRRHELIGGVTLSRLNQDSPAYPWLPRQSITNIFNWASEVSKPQADAQTGYTKTREYQYSAYLNSRLQLSDATSLLLGSRLINWKQDSESVTYSSGNVSSVHLREKNIFVPYVGIVHALNDTYSVYASYTKIFNPQPDYVIDINGNRLAPEEGTSVEVGIKGSFADGALTSSLSLFRTQQDTYPEWDGTTRTYTALNGITTKGVEVELAGELMPDWQISAGYTYSEVRGTDGQRLMTRIPLNTAKLFTSYRLKGDWNKLTLGGGIHWESKTGDQLSVLTQHSYALVNLMARYEFSKQLSVAAHLNNVFDKRYLMGVADTRGIYGAPRNVMVSAKYSF